MVGCLPSQHTTTLTFFEDESIRRIIESNAVQTLVGRLQSTSPRSAVAALSWLAQNGTSTKTRTLLHPLTILAERLCEHIVRCDAVSPLVETLKGADSDYVISTLSWLAKNGVSVVLGIISLATANEVFRGCADAIRRIECYTRAR